MPNSTLEKLDSRENGGSARMLVHIAFHYVPARWKYLERVLTAFSEYGLKDICIVVDTNSVEVAALVESIMVAPHCSVGIAVHDDLPHPFALTWAHRKHMRESLESWDYFMYLEDDIYIPWSTFKAWMRNAPMVDKRGYILGFLRVESNAAGHTVSTDWMGQLKDPRCVLIGDTFYFQPNHFYQACWVYPQDRMRRFIRSAAWTIGFGKWSSVVRGHRRVGNVNYMREYSAFGMACANRGRPRVLLPLASDGSIPSYAWVSHLPNNYGMDPNAPCGRLNVESLIDGNPVDTASLKGRVKFLHEWLVESVHWITFVLHIDSASHWLTKMLRRIALTR